MTPRPRVFLDADAMFARIGQYTILDCVTSEQATAEAERNLATKAPTAVATFEAIVRDYPRVVPDPDAAQIAPFVGMADASDLPILVAALIGGAQRLITFNTRHYWPPPSLILVQRPGEFLAALRFRIAGLVDTD